MAITTATDWKVYQDEYAAAYAERVAQSLNVLEARGNGAIVIQDANVPGQYVKQSFFKMPSGLVSRRIATGTGSTSAVTPVTVSQGENVDVRLSRKIGPVDVTFDSLRKTGITPETFSMWLGQMMADARMQYMLNDALRAARAAINKTATMYDKSALASKTLDRAALSAGMAKLGDQRDSVVAWVTHSKSYGDLVTEAITPTAGAESIIQGVALYGAAPPSLGRPVFVTDSAALVDDVTVDKYYTLGLVPGAIRIRVDGQLAAPIIQEVTGLENLCLRIQAEADWFVGILGYAYDVTNGGANPDDTALATTTNWDLAATSYKQSAGVVIKST